MSRLQAWPVIVERAAGIVSAYDTPCTLRQLFYRLVSAGTIPNTPGAYKQLSRHTAQARRAGTFPSLADQTRVIHRYPSFESPTAARTWLRDIYRLDRTDGQAWSIYLAVEKRGLVNQLRAWFGELGFPILALSGYQSESYEAEIAADQSRRDRPTVLLYAGDFDPSGEDILRNFRRYTTWDRVERIALTVEQISRYGLIENPGKTTDTRAAGFAARHGRLVQVELDALAPTDLRNLFTEAIATYWSESAYQDVVARESSERSELDTPLPSSRSLN